MRRREVITLLGGLGAALPALVARGQVPTKPALIGVLLLGSKTATEPRLGGFPQGMQELGYVQGRNYIIEGRYADGDVARLPALFQELVQLKPDVILTGTTVGILEMKRVTVTIPIVGASLTDPVSFGLAASLAQPGGQVTGIMITSDNLAAKQMELALEILPDAKKIGMLMHAGNQSNTVHLRNLEAAIGALALKLVTGEAHGPNDLDAAFQTLAGEHVELVVVPPDGLFVSERRRIVSLAASARLPVLYPYREFVEAGGLLSYGVDLRDSWRRAAAFVDKILKGAKPADLPIEQPTNELVVNVKTAKALGLNVPPTVLARANQAIE
ncbi:MAG TPA: ABC transporter substrate-binding protein [Xanthobacteraceae bacterium]|jgi:putative ABC transport system substrate-binding protein|nr:ABC transporter substrate-binding protein [Xanthobacteraceae bacterium]